MTEPQPTPLTGRVARLLDDLNVLVRTNADGRMLQILQRGDLTLPQVLSMRLMQQQGPQRVSSLAKQLKLTAGAVSRLVDRLVAKGLVDRREHDRDRLQKTLCITPSGVRLLKKLDGARSADLERGLAGLDPALAATLERILVRVVEQLRFRGRGRRAS